MIRVSEFLTCTVLAIASAPVALALEVSPHSSRVQLIVDV